MEKHFDINEQGLSIRCKLICSASDKTARSFDHIAIVTHGFGSNKETAGTSNFGEHLTSKFKGWGVIAFAWPCHGMDARKKLTVGECLPSDYARRCPAIHLYEPMFRRFPDADKT